MDPVTILSVVATSSKLAKTAWDLGEALYTFTKEARIINKTLADLVEQARALRDPCELLAVFLEGIKHDVESHPEWAVTQHGTQLSSTLLVVQRQLQSCDESLEHLRKSTEEIRASDTNSAKKAWATFRLNLQKDSMRECRSQLSIHMTALNTSLHILNCNMLYLTHEPQQPLEDLRQEIEALREQTSDLESSPPMLSETQDNNQLLVLARDTVADGETIYAHSIDGGSISGNTLKTTSGRQSFLASWLHRQVLEASQHAIASVMEFDDVSITSRAFGDSSLKATVRVRWNRVDRVKYHEEANDELILERDLINTLFSSARVAFDKENYQDAKVGLQRTIATIHDFFPDACSIVDLFELQYMVAVATFYTTQARYAQTVLLEFLRQQGTSDRQRSRIAHASQLLAELYVTTGRLEAARSSCTNALRVHHYLTDSDNSLRYRCLALAARIETLSGNSVRADAYMYSINADDMEDYIGQYSHLITSKSLSTEQRTALSIRDATMFHGFSVNESNGTPKVIAAQNDPLDHSNSSMTLLHFAAIFRDTEYASTLIEGGADVNARAILPWSTSRWCDGNGLTPLKCAFLAGDENMTRLLVSNGASLQHPDTAGDLADVLLGDMPTEVETPSTVGQMLKCVVRLGWNIDSIINSHRQTLLHAATAMGNMELMKLLVSLGSSLKLEDKYGRMPLQTFGGRRALEQHLEIRDLLLQREPLTRLDNQDEGRMVPHPTFGSDTGRGVSELARCLVTRESTSSSKISSGIFR